MAETIYLGGTNSNVIQLGKKTTTTTLGQQLKKLESAPKIVQFIASPKLTGALVGALSLLTGTSPITAGLVGTSIPVLAGAVKTSPTLDKAISSRITDPVGTGEQLGSTIEKGAGFVESVGKGLGTAIETGKNTLTTIIDYAKEHPITTGATAGLTTAGLISILSSLKNKPLESASNSLVGAPVFSGGEITPPGALQIPTTQVVEDKQAKPMNVKQSVKINISNKLTGKKITKRYINKAYFKK